MDQITAGLLAQSDHQSSSRLPAMIVFSTCLGIFLSTAPGWAQEMSAIEDRMLRMEREIQMLKQGNEELKKELRMLQEGMGIREGADSRIREEASPEATSPQRHSDSERKAEDSGSWLKAEYKNGFRLTSDDGQFKFRLGGRVTGRFTALDSGSPHDDEFSVERARLFTNVTLLDYLDLRIQVEFAEDVNLKDGYLDFRYIPWAQLRFGQFKAPFTRENLQSHKYLDFADRSIAVENMRQPSRDLGAMVHGRFSDGLIQYQLAVLNGTGENKGDDNDSKDLVVRFALQPFRGTQNGLLSGLHLGASGTWGDQNTAYEDANFVTVAGTEFVDFASGTEHEGDRTRLGTEFVWRIGPASLKAEWMRMWLDDFQMGSMREELVFHSWYVSGSYLLTGEAKTLGKTSPTHPFNPSKGMWGAWELAGRYSQFHSDGDLFKFAMASGTDQAKAFTVGLNWYLNEFLRGTFNWEHTEFDDDLFIDGKTFDDEDAFLIQCQLEF
jgi:phosphate-selective porin OprO/OprP